MQPSIRSTSSRAGERPTTRQPQLGQDHTAEGDLDLSAIYVVHHGIRRDLRDFALAVPADRTIRGDGADHRQLVLVRMGHGA